MAAEVGIHDYMMLQDARWTFFYSPQKLFDGPMGLGKVQRAQYDAVEAREEEGISIEVEAQTGGQQSEAGIVHLRPSALT